MFHRQLPAFVVLALALQGLAWGEEAKPATDNPSDAQLAKVIAVIGREVAARKIIPDYKYEPAIWGTSQQYVPTYSSTPGTYYTHRSALWGLFGSSTTYTPGTTYQSGGYYETVATLVRPERFEHVRSYLTQLPHTTSDLELLQTDVRANDFQDNTRAATKIFGSAETAQAVKRLVTSVIENNGDKLTDEEMTSLRKVESDYLNRDAQKYWERNDCVRMRAQGCPERESGPSSRREFIAALFGSWLPGHWANDNYVPNGDKNKLFGLLAEASKTDRNKAYWKNIDELIQESNYDQFVYDTAGLLAQKIRERRVNSLGGLLRKLDLNEPGREKKKAIVGWNQSFETLSGARGDANPSEEASLILKGGAGESKAPSTESQTRAAGVQKAS